MGFRGKPEPRRGDTYRNVFQHASIPVAPPGLGFLVCWQPGVGTPGYFIPPFLGLEPAIANAWNPTSFVGCVSTALIGRAMHC